MRTVADWLSDYGSSHQNPTNKLLHWLCVPPIVLSVMGLLWSIPVPAALTDRLPWLNWAILAAAAAIIYYLTLSPALAAGVALAFVALLYLTHALGPSSNFSKATRRARSSPAMAFGCCRSELPGLEVDEGLMELGVRVHHERPVFRD